MDAPFRRMYRVDGKSKAQIRAALLEYSGEFDAELMSVAPLIGALVNTADKTLADGAQGRFQADQRVPLQWTK